MARKPRVFLQDTPQHIILRSLNELILFQDSEDFEQFRTILEQICSKLKVNINAYVLMPTFFEFVATPIDTNTLPKFMQSLGRKYVAYYNKKYSRSGTIWEGRYKASLVEDSLYLFDVMRYIEKLPVEKKLAVTPEEYLYSSIHKNLFDKVDKIITYHPLYKDLGYTQQDRISKYSKLFYDPMDSELQEFIETTLEKQNITASINFISYIEQQMGLTLRANKRGRPKKSDEKEEKKMYKNLQVIDKEKHKNTKVSALENLNFAKKVSFVPVSLNETALIGMSFPIVFNVNENNNDIVTIVSLGGDSLAINEEGKWITKYVPSYIRKYPFSLASNKNNPDQKIVLLDEESSLVSKSKGKQLFKKNGEKSELLENVVKFLSENEKQVMITKKLIEEIFNSGILEEREIAIGEGEEKKVLVKGFKVVDKEKLNNLSDDILASWVRRGIISFIDTHLKSLDNINTLFKLASQRQQ